MTLSRARKLRLLKFAPGLILGRSGTTGLMLTRRCNMSCPYCAVATSRASNSHLEEELPVERWKEIIDQLYTIPIRHAVLTGGEPTLYADICELARYAHPRMLVSMVSNAKFLIQRDPMVPKLLPTLDMISLSGDIFLADDTSLDHVSMDIVSKTLDEFGLNKEAILTITNAAIDTLPDIVEQFGKYGWAVRFSLVHPECGDNPFRGNGQNLAAGPEDFARLKNMATRLESLRKNGVLLLDTREFLAGIAKFVTGELTNPCPAGLRTMEITPDGTVQACQDSPTTGLTVTEIMNARSPKTLVRKKIPANCRCHYTHYYRHKSFLQRLTTAIARLPEILR